MFTFLTFRIIKRNSSGSLIKLKVNYTFPGNLVIFNQLTCVYTFLNQIKNFRNV